MTSTSTFTLPTFTNSSNSVRQMSESHIHNQVLGNLLGMTPSKGIAMMTREPSRPGPFQKNPLPGITNENLPPTPGQTPKPFVAPGPPAARTALSLLNEICMKCGAVPLIDFSTEGPVHKPAFECVIKIHTSSMQWEGRARAFCKKDAKQAAAMNLLQTMHEDIDILLPVAVKPTRPETPEPEVDPDVPGNPVGELNDLCMRVKLKPPKYDSIAEEGKPHARVYSVECSLTSKIKEVGKGRNKKFAKRAAANSVLKILHETAKSPNGICNIFSDDEVAEMTQQMGALQINFTKYFKDLSDERAEAPKQAIDLIQTFLSMSGPKIDQLGKMSQKDLVKSEVVPLQLLNEIGEEQHFGIELVDLGVQSDDPRHRCFIYCKLKTPVVRLGTGSNPTQAQKSAAFEVLEFLRNIIHK